MNAVAVLIGAALGILFGLAWRRIVSRGRSREFYGRIGRVLHSMLTDQDADFIRLYKTLILEASRFLGLQLLGIVVSLSPLIVLFWVLGPSYHEWRNSRADVVSIYPERDVGLLVLENKYAVAAEDGRVPIAAFSSEDGIGVGLPGNAVFVRGGRVNHAISPDGGLEGLLLESLGFEVTFVDEAAFGTNPHTIILRPWCGDFTPFWPYLSDPEFFLFLGMGLFSLPALFFFRKRSERDQKERESGSPSISFVDYMLTSIVTAAPGVFRWLGDKESRYWRDDLEKAAIDRPIFVTGLARSGTTIVLELLSSMPSVATHQYRDFPFVMTPMLWQRFTSLLSSREAPLERPHKDGILITRESPEAFEEPIWQNFFPYVHKEGAVHTIREGNGSDEFARFFSDHIRKILVLRNGTRYLSKGNYNLTRIQYLSSLFPDARFVIPVRHPIEHVWSLVRQNELFQRYAEADDRIPHYLRAAGHFEFGPQRVPICLQEGTSQRVLDAWHLGREHVGYAIQWAEVYRHVSTLAERGAGCADKVFILRYEDLCERPVEVLTSVLNFCGLGSRSGVAATAARIKPGRSWSKDLEADICLEIWEEVREVAEMFGYQLEGVRTDGVKAKEWTSSSLLRAS